MARTIVITGAASGIGEAAANLIERNGDRPIRVDIEEGDIQADLATQSGREHLINRAAALSDGCVDGIIACAGLTVGDANELIVRVNYFGTIATLQGLLPFLQRSAAPRAVAVSSLSLVEAVEEQLVSACLLGDEVSASKLAVSLQSPECYASSKNAIAQWVRQNSVSRDWAGANVLLNAVAPGLTRTRMIQSLLDDPSLGAHVAKALPCPLKRYAEPVEIARLLVWLTSVDNSFMAGQIIFADGGSEALLRGTEILASNRSGMLGSSDS